MSIAVYTLYVSNSADPLFLNLHLYYIDCGCNGIGYGYNEYYRNCCSEINLCGINQGDCDSDDQCDGDLVCGNNNCPSPFPSNADCCKNPA